jgi:hypothetical protein
MDPPYIHRMIISAVVFLLSLGFMLGAGEMFYRKRYFVGAALVLGGCLLVTAGLGLIVITQYPSTWGWWF